MSKNDTTDTVCYRALNRGLLCAGTEAWPLAGTKPWLAGGNETMPRWTVILLRVPFLCSMHVKHKTHPFFQVYCRCVQMPKKKTRHQKVTRQCIPFTCPVTTEHEHPSFFQRLCKGILWRGASRHAIPGLQRKSAWKCCLQCVWVRQRENIRIAETRQLEMSCGMSWVWKVRKDTIAGRLERQSCLKKIKSTKREKCTIAQLHKAHSNVTCGMEWHRKTMYWACFSTEVLKQGCITIIASEIFQHQKLACVTREILKQEPMSRCNHTISKDLQEKYLCARKIAWWIENIESFLSINLH